jgi:hypothetical protein
VSSPTPHVMVNLTAASWSDAAIREVLASLRTSEAEAPRFGRVRIAVGSEHPAMTGFDLDSSWKIEHEPNAIEVANLAMRDAARDNAPLVVLDGALAPDVGSLRALQQSLLRDPHFGFALPRLAGYGSQLIRKLDDRLGDPEVGLIPRSVIDAAPEYYVTHDRVGPCVLIRANVVRDFLPLNDGLETFRAALREFVARARRTGFRTVVSNRALVSRSEDLAAVADREAGVRDAVRLSELVPELPRLEELWRELPAHEYESLQGRAGSFSPDLRQSLVIDLTSMVAVRNGTTEQMLGIVQAIHSRAPAWQVTLLVPAEVASYHGLEERLPNFEITCGWPSHRFTAAIRLQQPWSLDDLIRLHRLALFNFVLMLDTILEDILCEAPSGLGRVWALLARTADGLLYISDYTRQRFRERFTVAPCVEEFVSHLALDPRDYCREVSSCEPDPYLYVVGNRYPHKWMKETLRDLSTAFPFLEFRALGYEDPAIPRLSGFPSGDMSEDEVSRLYANAQAIVVPSQYEGFGFPVIRGLSHGKTVIARRSELLLELAALYRGPGRLLAFEGSPDLVEKVGRLIHALPVESVLLGTGLAPDEDPVSWSCVADRILGFITELIDKPEAANWAKREQGIRVMELHAAGR